MLKDFASKPKYKHDRHLTDKQIKILQKQQISETKWSHLNQ